MLRLYRRKLLPFLDALATPERDLLPEYARQLPEARAQLMHLILIGVTAMVGAIYGRLYAKLPPADLLLLLTPLVVMALIVVWVLPDRDTAPTRMMTRTLLAFFAVSIAWPDYMALQLPGLPWISSRRLFLAPMTLLLLVALSTSRHFRKDLADVVNSEPIIWKMLLGFVAMQFISIAGAHYFADAVKNFINYQMNWTAVFFVAAYAFRSEAVTTRFLVLFFAACVAIGAIGILENMNGAVLWKGHVPSLLQVDLSAMSGTLDSPLRNGLFRAKSVYGQPLPFAEIMALVSPVTLYFIFKAKTTVIRVLLVVIDLLDLYVLTLPQSRLGILGFMIAHALFVLIWAGRVWMRNKFSIVGPTITLAYPVLLLGVAGAVMSVGSLRERVIGGHDTIYSDQSRKLQKRLSRDVILRNPLIGHGPRQGPLALPMTGFGRLSLDNYFLWIALDYGLIGFALYYGMILFAIHRMFMVTIRGFGEDNNRALLVLTTLTVFVFIKTVLSEEDNHSVMFLMLAMAVSILWREKQKSNAEKLA